MLELGKKDKSELQVGKALFNSTEGNGKSLIMNMKVISHEKVCTVLSSEANYFLVEKLG